MAKFKSSFVCNKCGTMHKKWLGQCSDCMEWNCISATAQVNNNSYHGGTSDYIALNKIDTHAQKRIKTDINELDRVLGGGFVHGQVLLLAGSPGCGKSTLLLKIATTLQAKNFNSLYISAEESMHQIAARATRMNLKDSNITLMNDTIAENIINYSKEHKPKFIIIDSIQCIMTEKIDNAPGTVTQVRHCAQIFNQLAKSNDIIIFMIGHVTKDEHLAGPMTLSHIVDTTLLLTSAEDERFRLLRATKNRFGAQGEIGFFMMQNEGLNEVRNPSAIFLQHNNRSTTGSVICSIHEGTRPLLLEIQALIVTSSYQPRRTAVGIDLNRLAMLLAIITKHVGIDFSCVDVFINVVGGVKINEPAADLACALCLISSLKNLVLPKELVVFGELGLSGEIRPVTNASARIADAAKHGLTKALIPKANWRQNARDAIALDHIQQINEVIDQFI